MHSSGDISDQMHTRRDICPIRSAESSCRFSNCVVRMGKRDGFEAISERKIRSRAESLHRKLRDFAQVLVVKGEQHGTCNRKAQRAWQQG